MSLLLEMKNPPLTKIVDTHVYDPESEVLTGLNMRDLINADPLRA